MPSDSTERLSRAARSPVPRVLALALLLVPIVLVLSRRTARAEPEPITLPPPSRVHLFLLVGQSNMAGRGDVQPEDRLPLPGVLALDAAGRWVPAVDPLHWDKPSAGVGLARSFALEYQKSHPGITVAFIPAACGGSPISTWAPGQYFDQTNSHPYDDAIARARRALPAGTLRGILWHQGESDTSAELAPRYEAALAALIERFRAALSAPRVPFLIGQLGQFSAAPWNEHTRAVDGAQRRLAKAVPAAAFVSSDGLTSKPDNIHFDSASLRELGRRYAAALAALTSERGGEPPAGQRRPAAASR